MEQINRILPFMEKLALGSNPTAMDLAQMKADSYNKTTGTLNLEDGYDCPICKNKGIILTVEEANGQPHVVGHDCKCAKTRLSIRRMMRSGLKSIIKDYTLDKFQTPEEWQAGVKSAAIQYAENPEGWFFFGGQSGSGKTHICTGICRELLLQGREVLYMLWRDEVVPLKASMTDGEEYKKLITKYKTAEVLYIDDLFKSGRSDAGFPQRPTGADINVAFEILNYRYNEKLPTVISSECTVADLMEIDEAVAGRIVERSVVFSLKPDKNRNYRLRKAMNT